jgi:uncharacterized protein
LNRFLTLLLVFVLTHITLGLVKGQAVSKRQSSPALLYEITGPGLKKPSYLFGTIHLICEKDMFSPVVGYLDKAEQLMLEMDIGDPALMQKVLIASMMDGGKSVKDQLTAEEFARIDKMYKEYVGIPFAALQNLKPMISSTYLYMSPKVLGCQPPMMYDNYFAKAATTRKLPVVGLETAEEQIAVLDSNSVEKQLNDLSAMSADPAAKIGEFHKLYKIYLSQDSDALHRYTEKQFKDSGFSAQKMLHGRNAKWIPKIEAAVAAKPSFIAVGAAHLGGQKGVVNLLRAKGYTVKPIRL